MWPDRSYLRGVAESPPGAGVKRRSLELLDLRPGHCIVDVGSGPAIDTIGMAQRVGPTGHVYGVDSRPDAVMAARATARDQGVESWTEHLVGLATALPLPPGSLDRWHAERLLQHLPGNEPLGALNEAARVVRRGGRVVVADTDWATLSLAGEHPDLERRIARLHTAYTANGYIGRQLPRLVRQAGLVRETVEHFALALTPESTDYVLGPTLQSGLATGLLSPAEVSLWQRSMLQWRALGDATTTVTMTVVAAVRP